MSYTNNRKDGTWRSPSFGIELSFNLGVKMLLTIHLGKTTHMWWLS